MRKLVIQHVFIDDNAGLRDRFGKIGRGIGLCLHFCARRGNGIIEIASIVCTAIGDVGGHGTLQSCTVTSSERRIRFSPSAEILHSARSIPSGPRDLPCGAIDEKMLLLHDIDAGEFKFTTLVGGIREAWPSN